jgi:hypothetical protein
MTDKDFESLEISLEQMKERKFDLLLPDGDACVEQRKFCICEFHKKHPDMYSFDCMCKLTVSRRKATIKEYRDNKIKKLKNEKKELETRLKTVIMELDLLEKINEHVPSNPKKD